VGATHGKGNNPSVNPGGVEVVRGFTPTVIHIVPLRGTKI